MSEPAIPQSMRADAPLAMGRVLGLDIGGSGSRARIDVAGVTVAEASAGSASVTAAGRPAALAALRELLGSAGALGRAAGLDAVCAGAAGSETGGGGRWLSGQLRELTGCARVAVVSDAALVLPAAGHVAGVAVIAGTGSVVHATDGARVARAGGWGYLLGDEGGGYRLVAGAIRVLLDRRDRGEELGALGAALTDGGDLDALVASLYAAPAPRGWAARAPALLACGDPAVAALIEDGVAALAGRAALAARRLGLQAPPAVLAGGLVAAPAVRVALSAAVSAALPGALVEALAEPPVAGAVALARRVAVTDGGRR